MSIFGRDRLIGRIGRLLGGRARRRVLVEIIHKVGRRWREVVRRVRTGQGSAEKNGRRWMQGDNARAARLHGHGIVLRRRMEVMERCMMLHLVVMGRFAFSALYRRRRVVLKRMKSYPYVIR